MYVIDIVKSIFWYWLVILNALVENRFSIYSENPLLAAMHETREEYGVDLREDVGREDGW